jgi:thiosulfate/3-mercaptopyruvate sulfurtransferase
MSSLPAKGCSRYGNILSKTLVSIPDAIFLHNNNSNNNNQDTTTTAAAATSSSTVKFIDGSLWFDGTKSARTDFSNGPRIADALFLDCTNGGNPGGMNSGFPPTMPRAFLHGATMDAMGVSRDDHLVVYGTHQTDSFFRTYVHLKAMGHPPCRCHVLDGSLKDWIDADGPTEEEGRAPKVQPAVLPLSLLMPSSSYKPSYEATDPQNVVATHELRSWIERGRGREEGGGLLVVDARGASGFQNGRMPGAVSLPATELLDPGHPNKLRPATELEQILREKEIIATTATGEQQEKRHAPTIVSTCGIGVSACVLVVALDVLGRGSETVFLYDGSWNEWAKNPDENPIVKG